LDKVAILGERLGTDMLKQRVTSSIIGVPLILLFLLLGRIFFLFLILILVAFMLDEYFSVLKWRGFYPSLIIGVLGGLVLVLASFLRGSAGLTAALVAALFTVLCWQVLGRHSLIDTGLTMTGILYIALPLSHLTLLYDQDKGWVLVLLVLIATWVSDIAAFLVGFRYGQRKLAPTISPNKSLEGGIAGVLTPAILMSLIFILPWMRWLKLSLFEALALGFVYGLLIGLVAPLGDLVESAFKREFRIKDTGVIIPGHGGFLDRFDSLIFTSVASFYFWIVFF
jgi:phosphatidate cytidylyltransferase